MTDREKLINLLTEFGIGFEVGKGYETDTTWVTCEEGMDKVKGYSMFMTGFEFDKDGKFIKMGAWE